MRRERLRGDYPRRVRELDIFPPAVAYVTPTAMPEEDVPSSARPVTPQRLAMP